MRRIVAVLVCAVVLTGCKVDTRVAISWDDSGQGVVDVRVALDDDAVQRLESAGQTLENVRVADLEAAGWEVLPWVRNPDGTASISASHEFQGEQELAQVLGQLSGPPGVVRSPEFTHDRGLLQSRDGLRVTADLRHPLQSIERDAELTAALRAAGIDTLALDQQLRQEARDAISLTLVLDGPGGRTRELTLEPGTTDELSLGHSTFHLDRLATILIGAMVAFLGVLLYLAISIGARRSRRRAPRRIAWDEPRSR
jgi:hypothetical protein